MSERKFDELFGELRPLLARHEKHLVKVDDREGHYYLDSAHVMKNGQRLFFGAVKVGKRYVSFHLMPVYVWPEMLDEITPALRKRMQGKSCFNFTGSDAELFGELAALTERCLERYREAGYLKR